MAPAKITSKDTNWLPWLVGIAIVLVGLLGLNWQSQDAPVNNTLVRPNAEGGGELRRKSLSTKAAHALRPLSNLELATLHDTVNRPLFEKSRRPAQLRAEPAMKPEPPQAAVEPSPPNQNALILLGVVQGERTIALLKRNQGGQSVRAEEGDVIDGWTIKRIDNQSVLLSHGQQQISLQLFRKQMR